MIATCTSTPSPRRSTIAPQELIDTAQRATIRFGAATLERLADQDTTALEAAKETAQERVRTAADAVVNDERTRTIVIGAAAGVTVVGLAVWLWRRRRRTQEQHDGTGYEQSSNGVPGWESPSEAFETTRN